MFGSFRNASQPLNKQQQKKAEKERFAVSFKPENFIPGLIIGFIFGMFLDLSNPPTKPNSTATKRNTSLLVKHQEDSTDDEELKMVLVVRHDLKMGAGKIASQCARKIHPRYCDVDILFFLQFIFQKRNNVCQLPGQMFFVKLSDAATGIYAELMQSQRSTLRRWELGGQAKIVVTCKNQNEMNKLKETAESIGLPTFVVADAGRTQISAGSKTVLAVGPGTKSAVDSVTGKLRLL
ncbi:hypothetical protein RJ639_043975 [Escallonia herrerae]|uniref:peptidyl-tRNA hydrolase n=1 Tax=Escallonia herrerae TaxID=1293975 RepID=A0AA88W8S7_9ASTE|nr:hypothetical protein RJ639_043975 [Escallonia herrerae]